MNRRVGDTARSTQGHHFPGRRWLMVALRTLHLMAVVALGVVLIGGVAPPGWSAGGVGAAVLATGLAMLALDVAADHGHLRSVAGLTAVLKLVLVGVMAVRPESVLFWVVLVLSGVVSHAPASFRHRILVARRGLG